MSELRIGDIVEVVVRRLQGSKGVVVEPGKYQLDGEVTVDLDPQGIAYFYPAELHKVASARSTDSARRLSDLAPGTVVETDDPTAFARDFTLKPTNPKDAIGSDKLPVHLWPATATAMGCLGLLEGALKYGRNNWRETGVRASIYIDALERHARAWFEGEDLDPDSGAPHLAHALACLAIIVDAEAAGKLNDDRNYPGGYRALVSDLTEFVPQMKEHHAAKSPKHWTIADA